MSNNNNNKEKEKEKQEELENYINKNETPPNYFFHDNINLNLNLQNDFGTTILMVICSNDYNEVKERNEIMEYFIVGESPQNFTNKNGEIKSININLKDNDGFNALYFALENRSTFFVKELLKISNLELDLNKDHDNNALIRIIKLNNLSMLKYFKINNKIGEFNFNKNYESLDSKTPLIYCINKKNFEMTNYLITNFNIDLTLNFEDKSLIKYAINVDSFNTVKLLLKKNTKYKNSNLLKYVYEEKKFNFLKLLINAGINLDNLDNKIKLSIIMILLSLEKNINKTNHVKKVTNSLKM